MNWDKGHICSAHWSHGERKSINDLPNIPIPADQIQKIQEKYETAKNVLEKYKTPPQKLHIRYKNAKRKLDEIMTKKANSKHCQISEMKSFLQVATGHRGEFRILPNI